MERKVVERKVVERKVVRKLYLGDSFIKIFKHVKKHNDSILSFSGMCINYLLLQIDINCYLHDYSNTNELILNFGSNDLYLDLYYNLLNENKKIKEKDILLYIDNIVFKYYEFINKIICENILTQLKKIKILIPYYSPIESNYINSLNRYKRNKKQELIIDEKFLTLSFRNNILDVFKEKLINILNPFSIISFIDINHLITDDCKLDDITDMHYKYEPILKIYKQFCL